MNLEHKEKQAIFDVYARSQGYKNWLEILLTFKSYEFSISVFNKHIFNATDLIQRKALERASDSGCNSLELYNSEYATLEKSITNENNLIK